RISPQDLGIWSDAHVEPLGRIVRFIHEHGSVAGMQLAHAGREASTWRPWEGTGVVPESAGGWGRVVAPSPLPSAEVYATPQALSVADIVEVVRGFAAAARRARAAGFRVLEIHAAHGYLLHEFLSPLANRRSDRYGGAFENRVRIVEEVVTAVRDAWPESLPLLIRISATDWAVGGWDIEQSVALARRLQPLGVDLVDCSSGGAVPGASVPTGPASRPPSPGRFRREPGGPPGAVGMTPPRPRAG